MISKEKLRAVEDAIKALDKQFGKNTCMFLGDRETEQVPAIPAGPPSLELALGCGGYPRGRLIEVFGPEASGKTTLTLHAIAECQKAGGVAAFVDAEHALDVRYAASLGVAADRLLISQPDSGEQALEIVETLVRSGAIDLVVVDSVAALVPRAEIEGEMGDQHVGLQARLMSQALRKLTGIAHRTNTCIMFINQLRMKIGVTFGSPETTTGGNALKFYASMRIDVRRIGQFKVGEEVMGHRVRVKIVKNKMAPPHQTAELDVRFGVGFDATADLLDVATERGLITKNGTYYTHGGESLGQGREKARAYLLENPKVAAELRAAVLGHALPASTEPAPAGKAEPKQKKAA